MGDQKLFHTNMSNEANEEGKPTSSLAHHQKHAIVFLQEVLSMKQYHAKHGREVQPWEIGTLLEWWLRHQGKKELLNER